MTTAASQTTRLDALVWRYGRLALAAGFAAILALVLGITALAPHLVPWVPLALVAGVGVWWLFQRPLLNLCVVLASFVLVADFQVGIDATEVAYAVYYVVFLGVWFFRQVVIHRRVVLQTTTDRLVAFVLGWVTLYAIVSSVIGPATVDAINELQSWSLLAFYYPVKDAFANERHGPKALFTVLVVVGLFIVFRNMTTLAQKLAQATVAWQVTQKGRVVTNETLMMVPAFGLLCLSCASKGLFRKLWLSSLFLVLFLGLIMTQGRGYWLAFAFGCGMLLLIVDGRAKVQLIVMGLAGLTSTVLFVFLAFGDLATLLFAGLWNRVLSIGDAAATDLSLVNRFLEWDAVLAAIARNPILGYGMARPYQYYDITLGLTESRTWIHNGYLSVWYQFGIVGLLALLSLYYHSIRAGIAVCRSRIEDRFVWSAGAMAAVALGAQLVSTIPSNAWFVSDTLLYVGLLAGTAAGTRDRLSRIAVRESGAS